MSRVTKIDTKYTHVDHSKYRAEIDGLRAVAVLPVILFHAGIEIFSGGFIGVDVFFVISGFLITQILLKDLEAGSFNLVTFYERRARRILPALFLVMICCLPFAWLWMLPSQAKDFSQSLVAVGLFSSNFLFWSESGYFETAAEDKPLLHTWSLAVEEQFYLVFPLLLLLLFRRGPRTTLAWIAVTAMFSFALSEWMQRTNPSANFFLAPSRAWELLAGSAAAYWAHYRRPAPNDGLALLGLLMIAYCIVGYDHTTPFPGFYAVPPVLGAALIVLFSGGSGPVTLLLRHRILVAIGLISYSAYLWHQPLFAFARLRIQAEPEPMIMLSLSAVSLLLAWVSWRWVEQPARQRSAFFNSRTRVFAFSASATAIFIAVGISGHLAEGVEERFSRIAEGKTGYSEMARTLETRFPDCSSENILRQAHRLGGVIRCKQTLQETPEIILLGDSHAEHLFMGLAESMPNKNVAYYFRDGHLGLSESVFDIIIRELLAAEEPAEILVGMYYSRRFREAPEAHAELLEVLTALQGAGHKITLLGDIPAYQVHPERCVFVNASGRAPRACTISHQNFLAQMAAHEAILRNISAQLAIPYVTLHEPLCQSGTCSMVSDGAILYSDEHHLNPAGSRLVGAYLASRLRPAHETEALLTIR